MVRDEADRPWFDKFTIRIVSSGLTAPFLRKVMHRIDRPLLRLTGGRFSFARDLPILLLTTTGAKSGRSRTVPLLYIETDDAIAVIGSRFGSTKHPAWYHNLRADPRATVEIKGQRTARVARPADDDERAEIWSRAVRMYSGYDKYAQRANRKIPVMVLTEAEDGAGE